MACENKDQEKGGSWHKMMTVKREWETALMGKMTVWDCKVKASTVNNIKHEVKDRDWKDKKDCYC